MFKMPDREGAGNGRIEKLDPNLRTNRQTGQEGLRFYDVTQPPFQVFGLGRAQGDGFFRMPPKAAEKVSEGVGSLCFHTAGGRLRFCTDSGQIAVRAGLRDLCRFSHMPLTGTGGFALYEKKGAEWTYVHTYVPPYDMTEGYVALKEFPDRRLRSFTLYFPLYSGVSRLEIGLEADAALTEGEGYRYPLPVVFYGSSITQGGCVSRPGNDYPSIVARRCGCDLINLGFAGNAKGEGEMARYLAGLPMSVLVCDYDHNAPDSGYLERTLGPFLETIRARQPELPVLMLSRPNFDPASAECKKRREIVFGVYEKLASDGKNITRWIDGETLFAGADRDACTVDGTHPNDLGMMRMADAVSPVVEELLQMRIGVKEEN